ncbi:MAG: histidine kinase [Lachnospiraceae bacterium]|nr:histidine kinase [Lachnospiraceae bacterium]
MRKIYNRISLCTKFILLFAMLIFVVVGVFSVLLYGYFQRTVKDYIENAVEATINANTNELQVLLERIETSANLVHSNDIAYTEYQTDISAICEMIISFDKNTDDLRAFINKYDSNLRVFNNYFVTCFGEQGEYNNVLFTDTIWPIHTYMPKMTQLDERNGFSSSLKVAGQEWYQQAEALKGENYWFVQEDTPGRLCMARALSYKYITNGGFIQEYDLGVLTISFDIASISKHLDLSEYTSESEVFLIDDNEHVIYQNGTGDDIEQLMENLTDRKDGGIRHMDYNGRASMVHRKKLPLGLQIITIVPIHDIQQMTADTVGIIGILGVTTIAIAVCITFFISMMLVMPLRRFAQYMEDGNTEKYPCNEDRKDELGAIYKGFNHLMQQLKESTHKMQVANEEKKQAQLHALQAQINPHFVYNTLNSVSCLALLKGQETISDVLGNLTKIMRYNISNPDQLVTMAEEINNIRQYENIQRCCYRDSFVFEYDIAPEVENVMIPKLMIQPLVENSLTHGMNFKENCAKVRLSAYLKKDQIVITVWDNGKDADVDQINQYVTGQRKIAHTRESFGVRNVYERILGVFGEQAGLVYKKDEEGHTLACIWIPNI